jgi:phosphotransferase system enzyme I (PtsP)
MLQALRKLVQQVNNAETLDEALRTIVEGVRSALETDACSIWLRDGDSQQLTLMATDGLSGELEKKLILDSNQGLVGWVAEREEPINLSNASNHPRYHFVQALGEESFDAFLGAPIMHAGRVLGVIVVQHRSRKAFDEEDESIIITASAQLAGVLAYAEVLENEDLQSLGEPNNEKISKGLASASGIGVGHAVVLSSHKDFRSVPKRKVADHDAELAAFHQALTQLRTELDSLAVSLQEELNREEVALFDVYARMLDDQAIGGEIVRRIESGDAAEYATARVFEGHVRVFTNMDDEYLRERSADVRDLGMRLLAHLAPSVSERKDLPERCVLVARSLVATHLGQIDHKRIAALVSLKGSSNSHVAILARAMGIPTVMGCEELQLKDLDGKELIVDGYRGHVILNAKPQIREHYNDVVAQAAQLTNELRALKNLPARTPDGKRLILMANTGLATDAIQAKEVGAEGAGLYRTEIPFILKERFPSEREQSRIYRQQLIAFAPQPVTMRTLDVGGDKPLNYFPIEEDNPFLGWRGIRISLDHPEIFLGQVRAMMSASEGLDNLKIMLPMISSMQEFDRAEQLIIRAHEEMTADGYDIKLPDIGVMIEVPAAVYLADRLAKRAAFLSVGSNDLVQYLLAVDRNNERVADVYESYHPAVINALQHVAMAAEKEGKPVSLCGELASDPGAAVLLFAMGYRYLSLNSYALPRVKAVIRQLPFSDMEDILALTADFDRASELRAFVAAELIKRGVDPLLLSRVTD